MPMSRKPQRSWQYASNPGYAAACAVADDYLSYQLFTVPAHITGWLSISLTTSSLLKAVGVNAGVQHVNKVATQT